MPTITNREELSSRGHGADREVLLDVVEHAIGAVHPDRLVPGRVRRRNDGLEIDGTRYDLDEVDDLIVIGAGKGSLALVEAVRDVLGDGIARGVVVEKDAEGRSLEGIEVLEGSHPIPDDSSVAAGEAILRLAREAGEDDLVVVCVTGGASALVSYPVQEVTIDDLATTTRVLLEAGASIEEINAVRKHVSRIKGGRLARAIHPATAVSLLVVDEVAGTPWGPTVPDATTFDDAIRAIDGLDCWEDIPESVGEYLRENRDREDAETLDVADFAPFRTQVVVLADATDLCEAACARAREHGLDAMLLSTMIEGESREIGRCLAGIAKEVATHGRPIEPPGVIVSGGETTVTVGDEAGTGGPNQECALGFARGIANAHRVTGIFVGTDGTDGPTDIAGGIVDGETIPRAVRLEIDVARELRRHDAAGVLRALDDAVVTGPTGTNVMDLRAVLVGSEVEQ